MGNFEKLSVLVIVVIIVMILVVALYTWTDNPDSATSGATETAKVESSVPPVGTVLPPLPAAPSAGTLPPAPTVGGMGDAAAPGATTANGKPAPSLVELLQGATPPSPIPAAGVPAVTAAEPPKPAEPKIHVVEPGQLISGIARLYFPGQVQKGTQAILQANPTVDPTRMPVGTKLTIPVLESPAPGTTPATPVAHTTSTPAPKPASIDRGGWYTTKRGDTLTSISKRAYGTSERWPEIWIENMDALGTDFERPDPGIRIRIPR